MGSSKEGSRFHARQTNKEPSPRDSENWAKSGTAATTPAPQPQFNGHATTYGFGSSGRVTNITYPDATTSSQSWTSDNQVASATSAAGDTTGFIHDSMNRLTQVSLPPMNGQTMTAGCTYRNGSFPYSPSSCTDEQGHITSYGYTSQGLVNRVTGPDGKYTSASYNSNGTLATSTDAKGNQTGYSYATNGPPKQDTPPSPLGATRCTFNGSDAESAVTDGNGKQTTFSYNSDGQQTGVGWVDGTSIGYARDGDGNLTAATDSTGTTRYTYNILNELTNEKKPNRQTISYAYDVTGNPTGAIQKASGGGTLATYGFGYDAAGNLVSKGINGTTTTFSYNGANELTSASGGTTMSYSYDGNGDRTGSSDGTSLNVNAAGQLTSVTPPHGTAIPYSYADAGEGQRVGAGSNAYQYDGTGLNVQTDSGGNNTYFATLPDGSLRHRALIV